MGDVLPFPAPLPEPDTWPEYHAAELGPEYFTEAVALHRMATSWTRCDSCQINLGVWMVFSHDRPPSDFPGLSHRRGLTAIWIVCDGCRPPPAMCDPWGIA